MLFITGTEQCVGLDAHYMVGWLNALRHLEVPRTRSLELRYCCQLN
eukprot:COSAG01_NODE_66081_length_271_cov_0.773256_1_plen_45_part_01